MTNIFSRAQFGVFIGAALLVVALNALQYFGLLHPVMIVSAIISSILIGIMIGAPGYLTKSWNESVGNFHQSIFLRYRHNMFLHVFWSILSVYVVYSLDEKFPFRFGLLRAFDDKMGALPQIFAIIMLVVGYFAVLHTARIYTEKYWNVKSTVVRVGIFKNQYSHIDYIGPRQDLAKVGLCMLAVNASMGLFLYIGQIFILLAAAVFFFAAIVAGIFLLSVYLSRVISQFKGASITVSILVGAIVGVSLGWTHMDAMKLLNFSITGGAVGSLFHLAISKVAMQYHKLASNSSPYKRLMKIFA